MYSAPHAYVHASPADRKSIPSWMYSPHFEIDYLIDFGSNSPYSIQDIGSGKEIPEFLSIVADA